jgi:hypothetical protein
MSNGVLDPVRDSVERCASSSTRSTILVAAQSACSSASICCTLRLRLGVSFVVIDVLPKWLRDPLFDTPACRSLAPCADGVAVAPAVGAYPVGRLYLRLPNRPATMCAC